MLKITWKFIAFAFTWIILFIFPGILVCRFVYKDSLFLQKTDSSISKNISNVKAVLRKRLSVIFCMECKNQTNFQFHHYYYLFIIYLFIHLSVYFTNLFIYAPGGRSLLQKSTCSPILKRLFLPHWRWQRK